MSDEPDFQKNRDYITIKEQLTLAGGGSSVGEPPLPRLPLYYNLRGRHLESSLHQRIQQCLSKPYAKGIDLHQQLDRCAETHGLKRWHPRGSHCNEYGMANALIADPFNYGWQGKRMFPHDGLPVPTHYSPGSKGHTTWGWCLYQVHRHSLRNLLGRDQRFIVGTWVTWSVDDAPRGEHLQTSFAIMPFLSPSLEDERPELRDDASLGGLKRSIDGIFNDMQALLQRVE